MSGESLLQGANWWVPWISLVMGVMAYLLSRAVGRVLWAQRVPKAHSRYRERILERLHYLLNLQAEIADCEQELAELWEKAPDEQARLIVDTVQRARTMPRALLRLARQFGFDVPDEAQLDADGTSPAVAAVQPEDVVAQGQQEGAQVITPQAWTGRAMNG